MERNDEEWRDVVGYEGKYRISSFGRILSVGHSTIDSRGRKRTLPDRFLSVCRCHIPQHSYPYVSLSDHSGKQQRMRIHRLVAEAFIPNPDNLPQINHKDGNKANNHIENLEWCTCRENLIHAFNTGLHPNEKFEKEAAKRAVKVLCPNGEEHLFGSVNEAAKFMGYKYPSHLSLHLHKKSGKCKNGFYAFRVDGKRN